MDMNLLQAKLLKLIEDEEAKPAKDRKFILDCIKESIKAEGIKMGAAVKVKAMEKG